MKRILISLLTVGSLGAVVFGVTQAFFSDTETSVGNTFQAGGVDLQIDNTSYRTDADGTMVESPETTWELTDLTIEKFFNFFDLKPGDQGEDTISLHVTDNDSWACANVQITGNFDNGFTEPEDEMSGTSNDLNDGTPNGDLADELHFAFWADDGDNVFENDETIAVQGPASNVLDGATLALAQPVGPAFFGAVPLTGAVTNYIGKYYCYGTLGLAPVDQGENSPVQNTGFTCDGSSVTNLSQTDRLVGDIRFYVEQSRNNPDFSCDTVVWPVSTPAPEPTSTPLP